MKKYKVAIVGLGIMGRRMVTNFSKHPLFEVIGVWDPSNISKTRTQKEFPDIQIVETPQQIIDEQNTDLLYVACPPEFHKLYALQAIDANIPVYLEKPLGVDNDESEELADLFDKSSVPCSVNFVQASSEALEATQQALKDEKLGRVIGVDIIVQYQQWPREWQVEADWLRFRASGGYVREVLSHFIFVVERLFGPSNIKFSQPKYPVDPKLCETHILSQINCAGLPINIFGSNGGIGPDRQELTIWGSEQSFRISDFYFLETSENVTWQPFLSEDNDPRTTTLQRQLDNVGKWLAGEPHPLASVREALSVQKIIERLLI
ncbi:MAG: oxidoreductase [Rhodospirillaceae bacterium]|nr:oxidoreductase [Rhodospirillaceae bacterium]